MEKEQEKLDKNGQVIRDKGGEPEKRNSKGYSECF